MPEDNFIRAGIERSSDSIDTAVSRLHPTIPVSAIPQRRAEAWEYDFDSSTMGDPLDYRRNEIGKPYQ